ncbi:MAG: hypothetical protein ACO3GH_04990 [Ilumatobacteraceae bacterium]
MPRTVVNKWETLPIEAEYDTFGKPTDPALLLIMGFGAQMVAWDAEFAQMLADRGLFVIRFDNQTRWCRGRLRRSGCCSTY